MKNEHPEGECHAEGDVTCRKLILDYLLAYEDETMPEEERAAFRRHIEMCPPCVEFLATYEVTGRTLKLLKPKDIPADLARAVVSFVRTRCKEEK
ncbi:MAG TPA: anti-sigma factor [Thermoanaerobaculia bacterium]|nr:anti-sigma factor [Thermoanaerobaculia bacterium]